MNVGRFSTEVSIDEDDPNMQFETVPEGSDDDVGDVDFFSADPNSINDLLAETKNLRRKGIRFPFFAFPPQCHVSSILAPQEQKESSSSPTQVATPKLKELVQVRERPIVAEDFIRNFLIKLKLTRTLDAFNTEWYEKKVTGQLNPEDIEAVPDL